MGIKADIVNWIEKDVNKKTNNKFTTIMRKDISTTKFIYITVLFLLFSIHFSATKTIRNIKNLKNLKIIKYRKKEIKS